MRGGRAGPPFFYMKLILTLLLFLFVPDLYAGMCDWSGYESGNPGSCVDYPDSEFKGAVENAGMNLYYANVNGYLYYTKSVKSAVADRHRNGYTDGFIVRGYWLYKGRYDGSAYYKNARNFNDRPSKSLSGHIEFWDVNYAGTFIDNTVKKWQFNDLDCLEYNTNNSQLNTIFVDYWRHGSSRITRYGGCAYILKLKNEQDERGFINGNWEPLMTWNSYKDYYLKDNDTYPDAVYPDDTPSGSDDSEDAVIPDDEPEEPIDASFDYELMAKKARSAFDNTFAELTEINGKISDMVNYEITPISFDYQNMATLNKNSLTQNYDLNLSVDGFNADTNSATSLFIKSDSEFINETESVINKINQKDYFNGFELVKPALPEYKTCKPITFFEDYYKVTIDCDKLDLIRAIFAFILYIRTCTVVFNSFSDIYRGVKCANS